MSKLLKIFDIQTDDRLRKRMQGAMIQHAHTVLQGPDVIDPDKGRDLAKGYALFVLTDPLTIRQEMYQRLTANHVILDKITEAADGGWDTDCVPDQDIEYVVAYEWAGIAQEMG